MAAQLKPFGQLRRHIRKPRSVGFVDGHNLVVEHRMLLVLLLNRNLGYVPDTPLSAGRQLGFAEDAPCLVNKADGRRLLRDVKDCIVGHRWSSSHHGTAPMIAKTECEELSNARRQDPRRSTSGRIVKPMGDGLAEFARPN